MHLLSICWQYQEIVHFLHAKLRYIVSSIHAIKTLWPQFGDCAFVINKDKMKPNIIDPSENPKATPRNRFLSFGYALNIHGSVGNSFRSNPNLLFSDEISSKNNSGIQIACREQRKTKIVCAIGPASRSVEMLLQLLEAGMNVARLNFSHGDHEYHFQSLQNIREAVRIHRSIHLFILQTCKA
mmetsp:Transcript_7651/g.10031  ORF Transcript_7651/g.10031 Transcript_7651/m.10031 type:complete len:183 (+) Transcript_7651:221-769(+)